jgi:spore coat polysaccharide biosynthesis protein SpsF (cytidylyltransferase family)
MKTGIIIQARLNSTRFSQKIVKYFANDLSILDIIILRLCKSFPDIPTFIATGNHKDNLILKSWSDKYNIGFYIGSETDVLDRFVKCAEEFGLDTIIRICSDNPFLDMVLLRRLLKFNEEKDYDYCSYKFNNIPTIKTHFGFFSEIVCLEALKKVQKLTSEVYFHEHVTNFIYQNSSTFSCGFLATPDEFNYNKGIRLTVDTEEDFKLSQEIFSIILTKKDLFIFNYRDVIDIINENPIWKKMMKSQIYLNTK